MKKLTIVITLLFAGLSSYAQWSRDPAWSPDGKKIAYVTKLHEYSQVFIMDADGSNKRQITKKEISHYYPFFSSEGTKLVFMAYSEGTVICTVNTDGSDYKCLTDESSENADPHWSPDGSKIIFYSDRDGNNELYLMDADGSNPKRLTNHPASDQTPSISPDGSKIVFVSDRDDNNELYLMGFGTENTTRLTFDPRSDRVPAWSPDGKKVIWYSREPSAVAGSGSISWQGAEIYEINIDGTGRKQLTHNRTRDQGPVYSPDGSKILFTSSLAGEREVYVMDADGGNLKRLTFTKAD